MSKHTSVADLLNVPRTDEVTKQVALLPGNPLDSLRKIASKTFRLYDYGCWSVQRDLMHRSPTTETATD